MAKSCPIKSDPEWIALKNAVGERQATEQFVLNNYEIPKVQGYVDDHIIDINGPKFNAVTTRTKLNEAPEVASEIINKLNEQYPAVKVYKDGLIDQNGKWIKIPPGKDGMHNRNAFIGAVAWANDSKLETVPHEYAHDYIEMFQDHPLMRKAIDAYGVEALADKLGKDYVNKTLNRGEKNLMNRIWDLIRNFFGSQNVADVISENFYKGTKLSETIHEGNNIFNYNKKREPLKRVRGAMNSMGLFDDNSIELTMIDQDRAKDYIMHSLAGYNVFGGLETELNLETGRFEDIPVGELNVGRAKQVFTYYVDTIYASDRVDNKYVNRSGLSTRQINGLKKRIFDDVDGVHTQALLDVLEGKREIPPNDNSSILSQDYWLLIRSMQKLNYLAKEKNSILADDNKMISKEAVKQKVKNEIDSTQAARTAAIEKRFKSPVIRKFLTWAHKQINDYFITPYLTAKYLAGEGSVFQQLFYKALDHADTVKLLILQNFDKDLTLTPEQKKKLGRFSSFADPKGNIDSYKGKVLDLRVGEELSKVKLTDAEILSLYLTLKQTGDQSIYPDSDSPSTALIKQGFHLDHIEGRKGMAKTLFQFGAGTQQEIINHIESNPELLQITKNVKEALQNLYVPLNKTFKQQNGFSLPQYENYFPVTTYFGAYDMKTQIKNIENFKSIRDRVGSGQPLLISDVNKVLAFHSQNASSYSAYAIPIENNRKIVRELKNEYHGGGKQYEIINRLLNQVEGKLNQLNDPTFLSSSEGERDFSNLINKGMSNFAVAVLSWNIPVMMKQPISYLAAKEMIDSKYLRKAGWGVGGLTGISYKQIFNSLKAPGFSKGETILPVEWKMDESNPTYQEILKHSPKLTARFGGAVSKEMGEVMFEKSLGKDEITIPGLKKKDGGKYKISKARLMEGIKIFDAATVMSIWQAVEAETAELHPSLSKGSSEYYEHVAERTEHIVNQTQPTFDLMNRTNLSSMKNPFARTFAMFGSARSKLGALLIDGFYDFLANPTKANKVKFYKRMFNLAVLNGVAIAIVNSLAHGFDWEDEDEDGILIDDIGRWAQFDMINSAFGNFYFGGEIARKVTSTFDDAPWRYEIQNPLEMVVNDGMEAMINIVRVGKTDKRTGEYNFTIDDGLVDMLDVTTKMVGVPNKLIKYPEKSYDYFFGEE